MPRNSSVIMSATDKKLAISNAKELLTQYKQKLADAKLELKQLDADHKLARKKAADTLAASEKAVATAQKNLDKAKPPKDKAKASPIS